MNKQKLLVLSVLTIFVLGMALANVTAAEAKTLTLSTKMNKYCTKKVGKYKIQTYKWKAYSFQEVDVFVYKNGKMIKKNKYKSKIYYKLNGKSKSTKWYKGGQNSDYHTTKFPKSAKVSKVKVIF